MRSLLVVSSVLGLAAAAAIGCSSQESEVGADTAAVTGAEVNLARSAIALIAGGQARCNQCHTASKSDVLRWGQAMQAIERNCLAPSLTLTREQRIACISEDPTSATPEFSAGKLGLYAGAAKLDQFKQLFTRDGDAGVDPTYAEFTARAGMPLGTAVQPFTQAQFATIKKWVLAGMPALDEALTDPDLGPCTTSITPAVGAHLTTMKSDGWAARLADQAVPMYGCGAASGVDCLADKQDVTATWSADPNQKLKKLRSIPFRSHWWIRSSPDGRFTGFGLNTAAKMVDLTKPDNATPIDVAASYDPQFFPNNEGFSFAGTNGGNGPIKVCRQSVLLNATTSISLTENGCSTIISSVYQTIGAALDNSLYLMSTGTHVNDDGESTGQGPRSGFDGSAVTILTPMVSDGNKFVPQPNVTLPLPFEGDQALSPSNKLLVTRFGSVTGKRGFRIRRLNVSTPAPATDAGATDAPALSASTDVIGTVCLNGSKPIVSYDERFILTHQYVDPAEGTGLPAKSANVVLVDLLTGEVVRLTKMNDRQYAFAPHFRADGWIYFVVRDMTTTTETLVASDAAVRRLAATPTN